jgi:tRNA(His) 5'-end guanylyltransferase
MLARAYFSHKELRKKNNSNIQDMLMLDKGVNWNDIDVWKKRGTCVIRDENGQFTEDDNIPIFTKDRNYIETLLQADS